MKINLTSLVPLVPAQVRPVAEMLAREAEALQADYECLVQSHLLLVAHVDQLIKTVDQHAAQIRQLTAALAPTGKAVH